MMALIKTHPEEEEEREESEAPLGDTFCPFPLQSRRKTGLGLNFKRIGGLGSSEMIDDDTHPKTVAIGSAN